MKQVAVHLMLAAGAMALSACSAEPRQGSDVTTPAPSGPPGNDVATTPVPSGPPVVQQVQPDAKGAAIQPGLKWEGAGGGSTLRLINPDGSLRMRMTCTGSPAKLEVNVPSFTPIGSEDRFAFAVGQEPVTLVADPTRQAAGAGVTGEGPVPDNFAVLFGNAQQIGALYGTQQVGPHIPPPRELVSSFLEEC